MRQMVGLTLKSAGHDVVSAIDGVDGLAKAAEGAPVDLVITDVNMPGSSSPSTPTGCWPRSRKYWPDRSGGRIAARLMESLLVHSV
jgi:CheY-like chemotaxis protein